MDESNATCGSRLKSIGLENTVENRQAYRELLITTPGLGQYISGEPKGAVAAGWQAGRQHGECASSPWWMQRWLHAGQRNLAAQRGAIWPPAAAC